MVFDGDLGAESESETVRDRQRREMHHARRLTIGPARTSSGHPPLREQNSYGRTGGFNDWDGRCKDERRVCSKRRERRDCRGRDRSQLHVIEGVDSLAREALLL